ncbi:Uncharacterised protein [Clostridium putrefaciens]|uniref:Uncharacterized protein n=1 Tax=Clostridium putrefaciens TaxID=99675 RepID=A0A381J530_9CLOT|nr:hypothetical protein [Clostridium putrefaciens]SUY45689.1 Uncharacterised protein [Clostridium putrefaciens]
MKLLSLLKRVVIITKKDKVMICSLEKQKEILCSLSEPKDDYERSYFQYICQKRQMGFLFNILSNFSAFFLFIIFYFKLSLKVMSKSVTECEAVFLSNDISRNILPDTLYEEFKEIMYNNNFDAFILTKDDKRFVRGLWKRHPLSFYFLYKCMMKISMYSAQIQMYSPKAIITYSEYSFTSSVLTTYCKLMNVEHINVMHGEKLFDIVDSFFRFDRCYVWDEFYKDLFIKLRAYNNQFIVEVPPSLKMDLSYDIKPIYDFTYYLMNENEVQLNLIKNSLETLKSQNKRIAVRPHPRYSNKRLISKVFNGFSIEDCPIVSIKESFEKTSGIMSQYSTVLLQGSYNNKNIIIDNLTNEENYKRLFEVDYIMLSKPHKLLSEIINER